MPFTFYGDLLGISNAYKTSPHAAYEQLNQFYNLTFNHLGPACAGHAPCNVNMFSDSVLFWGTDSRAALVPLQNLYLDLLHRGLLLRGAIVDGMLSFEPRFTVQNFAKQLPEGDTLPRAVALAGAAKGSRLIIDRALAHQLLPGVAWHTAAGYIERPNAFPHVGENDISRLICPTPEGGNYELLYFGGIATEVGELTCGRLKEISAMTARDYHPHYQETIAVWERSKRRMTQAQIR